MKIDTNNFNIPDYLDREFFDSVMKSGLGVQSVEVENVKFTRGHNPGENYCSVIYRADVTYSSAHPSQSAKVSLIIKTQTLNDDYKIPDFFEKEANMYMFAFPRMETLLQDVQLAPKVYYATRHPVGIIVIKDMSPDGYSVADRIKGLDEEHCKILLQKLAQYHATSMKLARSNPEAKKIFVEGMINNESNKFVETILVDAIKDLAEMVKTWSGFEFIPQKLLDLRKDIFNVFKKAHDPDDLDVTVLTHNDLWTNNILFKYDENRVVDALLIDFQASFYCGLGIDLIHFLYTTPQYHLLESKRDVLVEEYYYKPFKQTLAKIGYTPVPSLDQVYKDIENREMSGMLWTIAKMYLVCMDREACAQNSIDNLGDAEIGTKIRANGMRTERYQATIKYILKRMVRLGKI